jgi:hypothetical protein
VRDRVIGWFRRRRRCGIDLDLVATGLVATGLVATGLVVTGSVVATSGFVATGGVVTAGGVVVAGGVVAAGRVATGLDTGLATAGVLRAVAGRRDLGRFRTAVPGQEVVATPDQEYEQRRTDPQRAA